MTLMPGVTYEQTVQFTPHGAVVVHVLKAPRPGDQNGLYQLAPVLARNTVLGVKQRVTQMEKDLSATATVAGINGDLFSAADGHPSGIFIPAACSLTRRSPRARRSASTRPARCTSTASSSSAPGRAPASGARSPASTRRRRRDRSSSSRPRTARGRPRVANAASVVLQPFPATAPNIDLTASVTAARRRRRAVPADGAVLMATGATAAKLQAEAPVGTPLTTRLILQPAWAGVVRRSAAARCSCGTRSPSSARSRTSRTTR